MGRAAVIAIVLSSVVMVSKAQRLEPRAPGATARIQQEMTPEQREHGRLVDAELGLNRDEGLLLDLGLSVSTDVDDFAWRPATESLRQLLQERTCQADLTMTATVGTANSFPTESGTYLFSEYALRPVSVFRHRRSMPGPSVTMIRPGGRLTVDGVTSVAKHDSYPDIASGVEVLVFLKQLSTGAYEATSSSSVWTMTGAAAYPSVWVPVTDEPGTRAVAGARVFDSLSAAVCRPGNGTARVP
jgi:hypothetical protein